MRIFLPRIVANAGVLLGVTLVAFSLLYLLPSDPARTLAGPKADARTVATIRSELGLDRSPIEQYRRYLGRVLRGDLGRSYVTNEPILTAIVERLPATAFLATTSLALAVVLGVGLGTWTTVTRRPLVRRLISAVAVVAISLPAFWVGMLLLQVVAFRWRLLPLGGFGIRHVVLPACTLAVGLAGYYVRVVATHLQHVLEEDYIRSARAKGLSSWRVVGVHALRNALLPLVTLLGLDLAGLMGGVVLTETVFNWPGIGRLAVDAVFNQDIPMILGTVLFSAVLVVLANTVVDLTYAVIDPRIARRP